MHSQFLDSDTNRDTEYCAPPEGAVSDSVAHNPYKRINEINNGCGSAVGNLRNSVSQGLMDLLLVEQVEAERVKHLANTDEESDTERPPAPDTEIPPAPETDDDETIIMDRLPFQVETDNEEVDSRI